MTRRHLLFVVLIGIALASVSVRDIVLYNPSQSLPAGFYLRLGQGPERGAIVTVRARDVAPDYAELRTFTDDGDRFLKRIAAAEGDVVCATGDQIIAAGRTLSRLSHDRYGSVLPHWEGCQRLGPGEVFLLGDTPDSFDGRYWGPTPIDQIEGVWRRL
jgi:type IV secretory pathway protease TraF